MTAPIRKAKDAWFKRRIMRLTALEKRSVNCAKHATQTALVATELLEHISLPNRPRSLELGCGQGALARLMVERFDARMIATDFDPAQVRLAEERLRDLGSRVTFQRVDARDLPFGDGEFDVVFSFGVMHHIAAEWRKVVSEVGRVLGPNGGFVFTDFYLPRSFLRVFATLFPRYDQLALDPLREVLKENGFEMAYHSQEPQMGGLLTYGKTVALKR